MDKEYCFCKRCGRKLQSEEARIKGYGAVCEKKLKHDTRRKLFGGNDGEKQFKECNSID